MFQPSYNVTKVIFLCMQIVIKLTSSILKDKKKKYFFNTKVLEEKVFHMDAKNNCNESPGTYA